MLRVLTLILCFNWSLVSGQTFNKRFHLNAPAVRCAGVVVSDSSLFILGTRTDSLPPYNPHEMILELDLEGNILSTTYFRDTTEIRFGSLPIIHEFGDNLIYAGTKDIPEGRRVFLSEVSKAGEKLWEQDYKSYYYDIGQPFFVCMGLATDEENNFYLINNAAQGNISGDVVIIKTDSEGNEIWKKTMGIQSRDDISGEIIRAVDGNLYVLTTRKSDDHSFEIFPYQNRIFKIDTSGTIIWDYITPESQGQIGRGRGLVEADDGGLVVNSLYGYEGANGLNRYMEWEKYIYKISAEGELVWDLEIPSSWLSGTTAAWRMVKVSDGSGYVSIGNDLTYDGGEDSISIKGWMGKVDDDGNLLWARKHQWVTSLKNTHELYDIKEAPDGGFVAVGYAKDRDADTLQTQAWVIKTDEYGCLVPGCQLTSADNPELPEIQVSLYPNPVADILNIWYTDENFQSRRPPRFQVTDALGRIWQSFTAGSNETTYMLSVRELPPGTYYLSCSEKEGAIPFVVF